jgi:D-mannonate dehydratase
MLMEALQLYLIKLKYNKLWNKHGDGMDPNDPKLSDAKQAGATGIVTALHHIKWGSGKWTKS